MEIWRKQHLMVCLLQNIWINWWKLPGSDVFTLLSVGWTLLLTTNFNFKDQTRQWLFASPFIDVIYWKQECPNIWRIVLFFMIKMELCIFKKKAVWPTLVKNVCLAGENRKKRSAAAGKNHPTTVSWFWWTQFGQFSHHHKSSVDMGDRVLSMSG